MDTVRKCQQFLNFDLPSVTVLLLIDPPNLSYNSLHFA